MLQRALLILTLLFLSVPALASDAEDPPGRVGRVSAVEGNVWLTDSSSPSRFAPTPNWPVTTGTALETDEDTRTEIRIGSTVFRFGPRSRALFQTLNDEVIRIRLDAGSMSARFRSPAKARETVVLTPQGNVVFVDEGRYQVTVERDNDVAVTAFRGIARMDGRNQSLAIGGNRRAEFSARGGVRLEDAWRDDFAQWVADRDRRDDNRPQPRYVSTELTGWDTLEDNGRWETTAQYGPVWYPTRVEVGWAPFRHGRWIWLNPWGWTWVDAAPWGFAVSHYGRWNYFDGRWGWIPGSYAATPVWAPAMVAFAGGNSRFSWSVSFGGPSVAWVPLGPSEVYVPWYSARPAYWQYVNRPIVNNVTVVNYVSNNPNSQGYVNTNIPGAVTAASAAATFARGAAAQPVAVNGVRGQTFTAVANAAEAAAAFNSNRIIMPSANPAPLPPASPAVAAAAAAAGVARPAPAGIVGSAAAAAGAFPPASPGQGAVQNPNARPGFSGTAGAAAAAAAGGRPVNGPQDGAPSPGQIGRPALPMNPNEVAPRRPDSAAAAAAAAAAGNAPAQQPQRVNPPQRQYFDTRDDRPRVSNGQVAPQQPQMDDIRAREPRNAAQEAARRAAPPVQPQTREMPREIPREVPRDMPRVEPPRREMPRPDVREPRVEPRGESRGESRASQVAREAAQRGNRD
ncbi:MAG TPA: DUF6600 domain-containing protein [Burkholderiaceae bacterium]|nr:DUF6600 domain-containing protein [Burkholderiaceae bacterium]